MQTLIDSSVVCPKSSLINACPGHIKLRRPLRTKMAQLLVPAQDQHHAVCRLQLSVACLLVFSILQTLRRTDLCSGKDVGGRDPSLPTKTSLFHSSAFIIALYSTLYLYLSLCANIWFTSAGYFLPAFTIGMFGWLRLPINWRKCIAWSRLELVS